MSEVQAVAATLVSLKTAGDMLKAFIDVRGAIQEQGKIFELQRVILSAHQSALDAKEAQTTLLTRIGELEKKIADFDTWESEKERYLLQDVGNGSFAYTLKEQTRGTDPIHQICPACYQHRRKSILQPGTRGMKKLLFCVECKAEMVIGSGTISQSVLEQASRKPRYSLF
jgi:hypothetical protein